MNSRLIAACLVACLAAVPALAGSAIGVWATEGERSRVQIEDCGGRLCGKIVWLKEPLDADGQPKRDRNNPDEALRARTILGLPLLSGFKPAPDAADEWVDGRIYDPESGKTYKSRMKLNADGTLEVRGYVGMPMFGRSTVWTPAR